MSNTGQELHPDHTDDLNPLELWQARIMLMNGDRATPPKFRAVVKMAQFMRRLKGEEFKKFTRYPSWRDMKRTTSVSRRPRALRGCPVV